MDVPGSKFAFKLGGQQIRYLTVDPKKQTDRQHRAGEGERPLRPVVMAVTVEGFE